MQALRDKYEDLIKNAGSEEQKRLRAKLEQEMEELESKRAENARIMELQNEDLLSALRVKEREELEKQLRDMLVKINLMNEVCQLMGKYNYRYEPHIAISISESGEQQAKAVCRAIPDAGNREVYNSFDYGELVTLYYNVM